MQKLEQKHILRVNNYSIPITLNEAWVKFIERFEPYHWYATLTFKDEVSQGRAEKQWLGDWLNYGERKYGEMYSQALEVTGYEAQTLRVFKYVAERVEMLIRVNNLEFGHHRVVAPLEPKEQKKWLDIAEKE